uniref:U1-type domain-containing protein n=1 Tax=Panagrellus redivivus TaxID=6233 RepID=A0A7E4VMK3_PANRE
MSFYDKTGASASAGDHRRKWDTNEYTRLANERKEKEREEFEEKNSKTKPKGPKVRRELLHFREEKVDLESRVGKQVTINKTTTTEATGGFYCELCECNLKDSINYLDHINGKNHQRKLGFSMKVKRSTVDDVAKRFEMKKAELAQKAKSATNKDEAESIKEEQAKIADLRRQKELIKSRKRAKEAEPEEEGEVNDEMAAMMGFGGFGSSKKPR